MKVRALKECFHGGRRRKGDVFEYVLAEGKKLPAWLEHVANSTPVARAEPGPADADKPISLSELGQAAPAPVSDPETLAQTGVDSGPGTLPGAGPEDSDPDLEPEFLR